MSQKRQSPLKAIRSKCLDCVCGKAREVELCPISDCSLYPFRLGNNPLRVGIGNKRAVPPKNPNSSS